MEFLEEKIQTEESSQSSGEEDIELFSIFEEEEPEDEEPEEEEPEEEVPPQRKLVPGKIVEVPIKETWAKPPRLIKKGKRNVYVHPEESEFLPIYVPAPKIDEYGQEIKYNNQGDYGDEEELYFPKYKEDPEDPLDYYRMEGKWEKGVDFVEKLVDVYEGAAGELAKRLKVNKKVKRLVPINVMRKTRDIVNQPRTEFLIVNELGELVRRYPPYRKTKLIGGEFSEPMKRSYSPSPRAKMDVPLPPPLYEGPVKFGSRVEFTGLLKVEGEYLLLGYEKNTIKIIELENGKVYTFKIESIENITYVSDYPVEIEGFDEMYVRVHGKKYALINRRLGSVLNKDQRIAPGTIIKIKVTEFQSIKGIVFGFTNSGFEISGENGGDYEVAFSNPTLREIKRKVPPKSLEFDEVPSIYETMVKPVDIVLRKYVRDRLFRKFSKIIPGIKYESTNTVIDKMSSEEINMLTIGIKPWGYGKIEWNDKRNRWVVSWDFENKNYTKEFPVMETQTKESVLAEVENFSSNGYYAENFRSWMYNRNIDNIVSMVKSPEVSSHIQKEVDRIVEALKSPNKIINDMKMKYGEDILDLDGYDIRARLNSYKGDIELIDVFIKTKFESMSLEKLRRLKGNELAVELSIILKEYFRIYPPDFYNIKEELEANYIWNRFMEINPTGEDRALFEKEKLEELQDRYREYLERYENARTKNMKIQIEEAVSKEEKRAVKHKIDELLGKIKGAVDISLGIYDDITEKGYQLFIEVEQFERDCYMLSNNGQSIIEYLSLALYPLIFLEDPLDMYAKFFKEKLASGHFKVSSLSSASLPYYFPELAMNFNALDEEKWDVAIDNLTNILYGNIKHVIKIYIGLNYPSRRREGMEKIVDYLNWAKYITSITRKCDQDTDSGKTKARDKQGNVIYKVKGRKKVPEYIDIPLKDVVICYDKSSDKFSCHSLGELFINIKTTDEPINPHTGEEFPADFIDKIKKRYAIEIEAAKMPITTPTVIDFTDSDDDDSDLFGTSDEESEEEEEEEEVIDSVEKLNDLLPEGKLSLVYVYTEWSAHYKTIEDFWEDLKYKTPHVTFFRIEKTAMGRNYGVKKVPSFVLLRKEGGNITELGLVGGSARDKIEQLISANS